MQYFLFFALSFISTAGNTQPRAFNRSLTDSTQPYLYIGVDNALEIDWKELNAEDHHVSISGGGTSITKYSSNKYIVKASAVSNDCFVHISNKKGKAILKQLFKVRFIPEPYISLGGVKNGTTVNKSMILANPYLIIDCNACFFNFNTPVISFVLTAYVKGNITEIPATGNQLTEKQMQLIKNAENLLTIDNIRAIKPGGKSVNLPSIVIYLKNEEFENIP